MKAKGMWMLPMALLAGMPVCARAAQAASQGTEWTLQRSVARALAVAPELAMARADIRSSQGDLEKADDWPNPSVSVDVTNDIRRMYHESGYTVDAVSVSQALPLWRIRPQERVAREGLRAVQAGADQTRLDVEAKAARLFLSLQMHHDRLKLAQQRQAFARRLMRSQHAKVGDADGDGPDEAAVVRYVKPLDRSRLHLLEQTANDDAASASNAYRESLARFRNYLGLAADAPVHLPAMQAAASPVPLPELLRQSAHGAVVLRRLRHQLKAAEASVDLQKVRRFDDPVVSFVHGRNVSIYNNSYSYDSVQLSVTLPLWEQNAANIEKAQAAVLRNQSELAIARRDLRGQLSQDHMQLRHLLGQARRYDRHVLEPAHRLLEQTERHYDVGAAAGLALVDAYNTYFNAKTRYLDLLYRGQQSAIRLHWHAGQSFLQQTDRTQP